MKAFKKLCSLLIVCVMLFSLAACELGDYNYAVGGGNGGGSGSNKPDAPVLDDDPTNDFTVTLRANGEPYSPRMEMYAYWIPKKRTTCLYICVQNCQQVLRVY